MGTPNEATALSSQLQVAFVMPIIPDMSPIFESLSAIQKTAQQVIDAYVIPLRRSLKMISVYFKKTMEALASAMASFIKPLLCAMNWKPLIYVVPPAKQHERRDRYLNAMVDPHGYFVLGDKTIFKLHSRTSRTGRFLHKLLMTMSEVVLYEDIESHIGAGDRIKAFKDLKYKLKQEGYELDYTLVRTEGIALNGILEI